METKAQMCLNFCDLSTNQFKLVVIDMLSNAKIVSHYASSLETINCHTVKSGRKKMSLEKQKHLEVNKQKVGD